MSSPGDHPSQAFPLTFVHWTMRRRIRRSICSSVSGQPVAATKRPPGGASLRMHVTPAGIDNFYEELMIRAGYKTVSCTSAIVRPTLAISRFTLDRRSNDCRSSSSSSNISGISDGSVVSLTRTLCERSSVNFVGFGRQVAP